MGKDLQILQTKNKVKEGRMLRKKVNREERQSQGAKAPEKALKSPNVCKLAFDRQVIHQWEKYHWKRKKIQTSSEKGKRSKANTMKVIGNRSVAAAISVSAEREMGIELVECLSSGQSLSSLSVQIH